MPSAVAVRQIFAVRLSLSIAVQCPLPCTALILYRASFLYCAFVPIFAVRFFWYFVVWWITANMAAPIFPVVYIRAHLHGEQEHRSSVEALRASTVD
jgi:hypothetical protein